jgi:hypothetical protein
MKSKLTLTIEGRITHRAKILARKRGTSLSQLVEDLLVRETGQEDPAAKPASFSRRWAGRMALAEKTGERTQKLRRKYGLRAGD